MSPEGATIDIPIERLREYKPFIATPCYGGLCSNIYLTSIVDLIRDMTRFGLDWQMQTIGNESLIERGRSVLLAHFLASKCTHLFWIDADIKFDVEAFFRLLVMDKDVIGGAYPLKGYPITYALNFEFKDREKRELIVDNGAIQLFDVANGFLCVKREVVEKMVKAYPELHFVNDVRSNPPELAPYLYGLFNIFIDPTSGRLLSEDYAFCRRWQAIGGKVWLDPNTRLSHVGNHVFEGDVSKILVWGEKENG